MQMSNYSYVVNEISWDIHDICHLDELCFWEATLSSLVRISINNERFVNTAVQFAVYM